MYLTKCAISGKEMKESDDVVAFPYFDAQPGDPEFDCCENFALRSEFEKWYLRASVAKKVHDFWIQWSREKRPILILAESENFLIVKGLIDKGVALFFLNHVFYANFATDSWKKFKTLIAITEKGDINTIKKDSLRWSADAGKVRLNLSLEGSERKDSIVIPIKEWQNLRDLISSISE